MRRLVLFAAVALILGSVAIALSMRPSTLPAEMTEAEPFMFGVIADPHVGTDDIDVQGNNNTVRLQLALEWLANEKVKFVILTGDIVHGMHRCRIVEGEWIAYAEAVNRSLPLYTVKGDHEIYNDLYCKYTGNMKGYTVAAGGFTFLFMSDWNQENKATSNKTWTFDGEQLAWLETQLKTASQPVIMVGHMTLLPGPKVLTGDLQAYCDLIRGNILLHLAGHNHSTVFRNVSGVVEYSPQSLSCTPSWQREDLGDVLPVSILTVADSDLRITQYDVYSGQPMDSWTVPLTA